MLETGTLFQRACSKAQKRNKNGPIVRKAIFLSIRILNTNPGSLRKQSKTKIAISVPLKKR